MTRNYSTAEVAQAVGVNKSTLLRWIYAGKIAEPKGSVTVGRIENRIWSPADLARAQTFREEHYRKRS